MERSHDGSILCLPGTAEEKSWLAGYLEVLSVRERIILSAAMARKPPLNMAEAVNCLLSLDEYEVRSRMTSYADLGEFSLFEKCVPQDQQAYFDLTALGQVYEDQHPGLFIGNCYVEYPSSQPVVQYEGRDLPDPRGEGWSVRLKLASEAVPGGVWLRLPDYNEFHEDGPGETRLALDALRVKILSGTACFWTPGASCPVFEISPVNTMTWRACSMTARNSGSSWMNGGRGNRTFGSGLPRRWSLRTAAGWMTR